MTKLDALAVTAQAMDRIRSKRGTMAKLARGLGVAGPSVRAWRIVPAARVFDVSRILGIAVVELRPDLFVHDPLRAAAVAATLANPPVVRAKPKRLPDSARAIWTDPQLASDKHAAHAVSVAIGHPVSTHRLYYRFGRSGRTKRKDSLTRIGDAPATATTAGGAPCQTSPGPTPPR